MAVQARKPTGLPAWPITVLAGGAGAGKTFTAIEASDSDLIRDTFYIPFDERIPDDYGDDFDFNIVDHDGTVRDVLAQIDAINAAHADEPTLLIFDSGSRFWATLAEEVQDRADARPKNGRRDDGQRDLWVDAAREWRALMERFRAHNGPVIITARIEPEREWKIEGHKTLAYDADIIVEFPERGEYVIRKIDSNRYRHAGRISVSDFALADVWRDMGLDGRVQERRYATARPAAVARPEDGSGRDWDAEIAGARGDEKALIALGADARHASAAPSVRKKIRDEIAAAHKQKTSATAAANTRKEPA